MAVLFYDCFSKCNISCCHLLHTAVTTVAFQNALMYMYVLYVVMKVQVCVTGSCCLLCRYWLPGSKLELLGTEPKQDEAVLKGTPIKSKRSVQQAYNRAKSFIKMVALGKEQQQQHDEPATSKIAPVESLPVRENGPRSVEEDEAEVKERDDPKQHLSTDHVQGVTDDRHYLSEDMEGQGHNAVDEQLPNSMQAALVAETAHAQEGISGSTNRVCTSSTAQAMASTSDGFMHDALRHEDSLLCQEDGVNLADSFRVGRKECRDQSFIAEDTTPMGSVDVPPNVHGVA